MRTFRSLVPVVPLALALGVTAPAAAAEPLVPPYGLPALERGDFNRLAAEAGLPLFWRDDVMLPGTISPDELAVIGDGKKDKFVAQKKAKKGEEPPAPTFTKDFEKAYRQMVELRRREAVARELAQGRPTLVETDLTAVLPEDQAIVKALAKVAALIDALHDKQLGADVAVKKVAKDDLASHSLIQRNHGPWCAAPLTKGDPFCNGAPDFPAQVTFSWPADEKVDQAWCEKIAAEPNGKDLTDPFTVVRKNKKGGYEAQPYTKAYGKEMKAIAGALEATAKLVKDKGEEPFKAYLLAAAKAFRDNDWSAADEAWSAMSVENSKYYLRVAPDETYWDPCGVKAGFHMSFAFADKNAVEWKTKLTGVRADLEKAIADAIGAPYVAREVAFHLPEFINIILNAGDSRAPRGATIGQALPNFGKVAAESRGRTVAMANFYGDADSLADFDKRDQSLFSEATLKFASSDPAEDRLGTVLHEAAHNLGPNGSYKVEGKGGDEIFGGKTDAILEELKAQTGALFFASFLGDKGLLANEDAVKRVWVAALSWCTGHIAQGMFDGEGRPQTYSVLSAIQFGELVDAGALTWVEGPAGSPDAGRFDIDFTKFRAAVAGLMKTVGRIKATGDVQAAKDLIAKHTSPEGQAKIHAADIATRVLRYPKAAFVYGFKQ